jgi:poly-gamma-glutamate synthesis protein (capsule biosynthesis protein)
LAFSAIFPDSKITVAGEGFVKYFAKPSAHFAGAKTNLISDITGKTSAASATAEMSETSETSTTSTYETAETSTNSETTAKLSFTGDLMAHELYNYDASFEVIKEYFKDSDFVAGNLETTLCGTFSEYPHFSAPDSFGHALNSAGFDFLSTANNHCNDHQDSILKTIDALDRIGLEHSGTFKYTNDERVYIKEINNIKFALLCYTYGVNVPHNGNLIGYLDKVNISNDIKHAKSLDVDIIIVFSHMGEEFSKTPNDNARSWARFMLESGADVVIGSHPHIVQEMEYITIKDSASGEDRLCFAAYSLGNFVSSPMEPPECMEGVILHLLFRKEPGGKTVIENASCVHTVISGPANIILPLYESEIER